MTDHDNASVMLLMAERDLDTLRQMLKYEGFREDAFGFFAQQATEKGLKAWILAIGLDSPWTHDLGRLFDILIESGREVPDSIEELENLSSFGVQFRYTPYGDFHEPLDWKALVNRITELIAHVTQIIGGGSGNSKA